MLNYDNRIFGLDLLRAFAVLFVVYGHGHKFLKDYIWQRHYDILTFDGVSIFFGLSGYLIGRILIKTIIHKEFDGDMIREFWIRRWFRTLPNYFLVLVFLIVSYILMDKPILTGGGLLKYFVFSQNLLSPHPKFFGEAWSLAVEEWFYLIIPIPFWLLTKLHIEDRRKLILAWICIVISGVIFFRFSRGHDYGYTSIYDWDINMRKQVFMRFDALMFGVLGAYLSLFNKNIWEKIADKSIYIAIFLFLIDKYFMYFEISWYFNYFTLLVNGLAVLLLLPKLSTWRRPIDFATKLITFISVISYSMYLLNLSPIQAVMFPLLQKYCNGCVGNGFLAYMVYWISTVILSYFLYKYFESPITALRDRWHKKNHTPLVP